MLFKNSVVLITGADKGIGRATAYEFAKEGARVIVNYSKSKSDAESVVKEIKSRGQKAIAIKCDVSKENQVKKLFKEIIDIFGRIDVLVNNAGVTKQNDIFTLTAADFQNILDVNLIGAFLCAKYAASYMVKQKAGKIINIASIRGINNCARKDMIAYSAAKAGVINMTMSMAKALSAFGVNVNAIAPGITNTHMVANLTKEARAAAVDGAIIKRMAEPREVADMVLFLSSEKANYITGEVIAIDGGYRLTKL